MRYEADAARGELGPEEIAMNDWLEDAGPYITLPADSDPDGPDDEE